MTKCRKQYRHDRRRKKLAEVKLFNIENKDGPQRMCKKCYHKKDNQHFQDIQVVNKTKYTTHCLRCRKRAIRALKKRGETRNTLFKQIIDKAKEKGCVVEGCCVVLQVLEMDHLDEETKSFGVNVSGCQPLLKKSMTDEEAVAILRKEITKCQVVCRFHHQIKSQKQHQTRGLLRRMPEDSGTKEQQRCRKKASKTYLRNREHVINHKIDIGHCHDCVRPVTRETVFGFDFDHRDRREKYKGVGALVSQYASVKVIDEEIAKCDLRCANCHHIKTNKELIKHKNPFNWS